MTEASKDRRTAALPLAAGSEWHLRSLLALLAGSPATSAATGAAPAAAADPPREVVAAAETIVFERRHGMWIAVHEHLLSDPSPPTP